MRIVPIGILKSLAFALLTLAATSALVAAGLNEGGEPAATSSTLSAGPAR